jgi:hypothetical protein
MQQTKFFSPRMQNVDVNGDVVIGSLEFYKTGSTTKITTYSNYDRSSANTNPLNADSNGRFGPVFFAPADIDFGIAVSYFSAIDGATGSGTTIYTDDRYDEQVPIVAADVLAVLSKEELGHIMYPRSDAETSASILAYNSANTIGDIMFPQYLPGDIRRYGANADGTDDYLAFRSAILQNEQSDDDRAPIRSQGGNYFISAGLEWCTDASGIDRRTWHADNTILESNNDINILTIGPILGTLESFSLQINGYLEAYYTGTYGNHTKAGIKIQQVYSSTFNIGAFYCKVGIHLHAYDSGCVYNTFHLGQVRNNETGVYLQPTNTGWVNENTFYGGRFGWGSGTYQWQIDMRKDTGGGSHPVPNNNAFMRPSLEHGSTTTCEGWYRDGGYSNLLFYPRMELGNTATFNTYLVWLEPTATAACIFGGYDSRAGDESSNEVIHDEGCESRLFAQDKLKMVDRRGGNATTTLEVDRVSANSAAVPVPLSNFRDLRNSGTHQVIKSTLRRQAEANSYFYEGVRAGDIIRNATSTIYYECIVDHTSGALTTTATTGEPGTCTGWEVNWVQLPARDNNSGADLGYVDWADSTPYEAEEIRFKVNPYGHISVGPGLNDVLPSIQSGTGTPSGSVNQGSIYIRTDGANADELLYVATDSSGTWLASKLIT